MNEKISSGEVMTICVAIMFAMFPGFANTLILTQAKNASLISLGIAFLIGLIPIFMIMFISKKIDTNLTEFINKNFKSFGIIINILLLIALVFTIFLSSWLAIDFIISQFLTRSSYYLMAIFISVILAIIVNKKIEVLSRTVFILFIMSVPILVILLCTLIPYVELNNLKPYIDVPIKNILKSSFVFLTLQISPAVCLLELKNITHDKQDFKRKILIGYIIATILILLFLFFIISVFGIDLGSLLTYPVYGIFKKVQIFGFIERIENFAAMFLITAYFAQFAYFIYVIKNNICKTLKIKKKKKETFITYFLSISIPLASIYLFQTYNLQNYLKYTPYIISIFYIILIILFIRCLFIKTKAS